MSSLCGLRPRSATKARAARMLSCAAARGNATVKSFFAPYACDRCGRDESVLLDTTDHRSALEAGRAPSLPCSECGEPMAFNDFPERYFSFLVEGE